jgi:hypothetical protein
MAQLHQLPNVIYSGNKQCYDVINYFFSKKTGFLELVNERFLVFMELHDDFNYEYRLMI